MYPSLYEKIGSLPDDTNVWPGHEYTVSNLAFASRAVPGNTDVAAAAEAAKAQRDAGSFTIPSTIGAERRHNLFLRCDCAEVSSFLTLQECLR